MSDKNLLKYSAQVVVNLALGYTNEPFHYSLQEAFNYVLGETDLHKYSLQSALQQLTGRSGQIQHILNAVISESNSPNKYSVQAALNLLDGYVFPDDEDLQGWLYEVDGSEIIDLKNALNASIIHPCLDFLADTTFTLDAAVPVGTTITKVNGSAVTTGYSMNTTTISVDFSELPESRLWSMELSNGSKYDFFKSKRIFDYVNDNHITLNGTYLTHYDYAEQSEYNPYETKGFNKGHRQITDGVTSSPNSCVYGTRIYGFYNNGSPYFSIISSLPNQSSTNGYFIATSNNRIVLVKETSGSGSILSATANNYIKTKNIYYLEVVFTNQGVFTIRIVSPTDTNFATWTTVSFAGGSGTNPVTDTSFATNNWFVMDNDAGDMLFSVKFTDLDGNVTYPLSSPYLKVKTGSAEIIDIPEGSTSGKDIFDSDIVYTQTGGVILNAQEARIDFDPEAEEDEKLDIYNRDDTDLYDTDVSQIGGYDPSLPYSYLVSELQNESLSAMQKKAGKITTFMQEIKNCDLFIGVKKALNYDGQRLDGTDADTTTINRISNMLNTPAIADLATQYNSALYVDASVRNSVLDAGGDIADVGYLGSELATLMTSWTTSMDLYEVFTTTGGVINSAINSSANARAITNIGVPIVAGKRYILDVNVVLNSGQAPITLRFRDGVTGNSYTDGLTFNCVNGRNVFIYTGIMTGNAGLFIYNNSAANFGLTINSFREIGDTVAELIDLSGNSTVTQATAENQGSLTPDGGILFTAGTTYTIDPTTVGKVVKVNGEAITLDSATAITYTDLQDELETDVLYTIQVTEA